MGRNIFIGMLFVALAAPAASQVPGANGAESYGAWTEIFHMDCKGNVNFMNNHLLAARASVTDVLDMAQYLSDRLFERAKGACPALSQQEFARDFVPSPSMFVNYLMGTRRKTDSSCTKDTFTLKFAELHTHDWRFQLPDTCSLESLASGKGCLMKLPLSDEKDSFVNLAIDTCDAKLMKPFVSVTCSGPLCSRLAMPCGSDSECGGKLKCTAINDATLRAADEDVRDMLIDMDMLDEYRDNPKCFNPEKGGGDIIGSFMSFFRSYYDGKPWTWKSGGETKLSMCGGNLLDPADISEHFVDPMGCSTEKEDVPSGYSGGFSGNNKLVCNGLQPWDGVLADGKTVLDARRKQGEIIGDAGTTCTAKKNSLRALLDVSCWGQIGINLGKRMTAQFSMRRMPELMEWYATTMKQVQDCRGDGSAYSLAYYTANFVPWMPTGIMQRFTATPGQAPGAAGLLPEEKPVVSKPIGDMMNDMQAEVAGRLKMPDKCSFATWLRTGKCVMEYAGLSSLIGSQLTLRFRMETCPLNKHMPRIQVDCEGPICSMMTPATRCQSDSDCASVGPNMECANLAASDVDDDDDRVGALLWPDMCQMWPSWWRSCDSECTGSYAGVFSRCNSYAARTRLPDNYPLTLETTCDSKHCNPGKFRSELGNLLTNHMEGKPYVENVNIKFCTPRVEKIVDDLEGWSKNQYTTAGDIYTIAGMRDSDVANIGFCAAAAYPVASIDTSVKTVFKVASTATLTGYSVDTFGDQQKQSFRKGVAVTLDTSPDSVRITGVKAAAPSGRHLLAGVGVDVSFEVQYAEQTQAESVKEKVAALKENPAKMEEALKVSGLDNLESLAVSSPTVTSGERFDAPVAAPPVKAPPKAASPTPPPEKSFITSAAASTTHTSSFLVWVAAVAAVIVNLSLIIS